MKLISDAQASLLPNFICVGAEKSGSTFLYDCLRAHPDIYMSPIKETNFFSSDVHVENFRSDYRRHETQKHLDLDSYFRQENLTDLWGAYLRKPEQYMRLFHEGEGFTLRGEVSNSYLYSEEAARNIVDTLPDVRILVVLRDPVSRAFSHYRAMVRDGRAACDNLIDEIRHDQSFEDRRWGSCHGYIDHGLYAGQLARLFDAFERDKVAVILADDFFGDRETTMDKIFQFLQVKSNKEFLSRPNRNLSGTPRKASLIRFLSRTGLKSRLFGLVPNGFKGRVKNLFFSPQKQDMTAEERDFLRSFFVDEIDSIEELLNIDLARWRVSSAN